LLGNMNNVEKDPANSTKLTTVKRVHAAQLQMLKLRSDCFDKRISAGRIIEGHGDLRPEHIYFLPEPVVIDCIEFSRQFRQLDVADELSFLVSECDYIGAPKIGRRVADQCLKTLRDAPPIELLAFHRCYRACVRAKVALLRSRQLNAKLQAPEVAQALRHLELAIDYADELRSHMSPLVAVVHGLPGSGKSTLAKALADEFGAELLSTDAIRRQMFGPSSAPADFNSGHYVRHLRLKINHSLIESADAFLQQGIPVILDGAFPWIAVRREAAAMAARHRAKAIFFRCCCPESVALDRISRRLAAGNSLSEVRPELYARQRAEEESSPADLESLDIDTTVPMSAQLETVLDHLKINAV
jgi:predicted kinase